MANISIIGSGFSGLAAAAFCAQQGHSVDVFEKNDTIGGRARHFIADGFLFDMGPSWYWMPDVFESFFAAFNKKPQDYYELVKLDPGFQIIFGQNDVLKVSANEEELYATFEKIEKGSSQALKKYLAEAEFKYGVGMGELIYKPAQSWLEYATPSIIGGVLKSHIFRSVSSYVRRYFKDERLIALMEFPVLFLGAMPDQIPALYSLMNHAALKQGTFYPMGGMCRIIEAMQELAQSQGVKLHTSSEVRKINVKNGQAVSLDLNSGIQSTDGIIASADYQFVEQHLLPEEYKNYKADYWDKKVMAPSSLIFYLGVNKKLPRLEHHNLFFDADFKAHAEAIYHHPEWPENPLFYACCPSKTDSGVAPEGMENLFVLIPVAAGLKDDESLQEHYFKHVISRMEKFCGVQFSDDIVFKRTYSISNFIKDYNAFKGNAYGLANVLNQTAVLKPSIRNKKISNLFYAGQLTVPGPGVPPALISGQIAARELNKHLNIKHHESII